jgi:hypothetical protein
LRTIESEERRRESLRAHQGSQRAQDLGRTRDPGNQNQHESHGDANGGSRMESDRSREVLPSNRRHGIGRHDAHNTDDCDEERDDQRGNPHVPPTTSPVLPDTGANLFRTALSLGFFSGARRCEHAAHDFVVSIMAGVRATHGPSGAP